MKFGAKIVIGLLDLVDHWKPEMVIQLIFTSDQGRGIDGHQSPLRPSPAGARARRLAIVMMCREDAVPGLALPWILGRR